MSEIYYYKGKPYTIREISKIKIGGIWIPVVIYECQYENPDGQTWVRTYVDFFNLFKKEA